MSDQRTVVTDRFHPCNKGRKIDCALARGHDDTMTIDVLGMHEKQAAAEKFQWTGAKSSTDRGFGIACGTDKGGFVATCAEVSVDPSTKKVRIHRVVQAWECGAIVNPDGLRNQVQGALVMGIGGALFERILFSNGRVENARLSKYRVPRFSDVPQIDVVLIDRKDLPSAGAGETGIVGIAPAVGNAIFAATGTRLRHMPMTPENDIVRA